jgi:hypothetical protein
MSDWAKLNAARGKIPPFQSKPEDGFNGMFLLKLNGMGVCCVASDGEGWQHVSVSLQSQNVPSWSIMCQVKDLFWEPEDWVVQFHPAESEYVNFHPGCLHLWRCLTQPFPTPDRLLVGVRDEEDMKRVNADPTSPFKFKL